MRNSLTSYLRSVGWQPAKEPGPDGTLWRKAGQKFAVPVPNHLDDNGPDWDMILDRLAWVESSDPVEIEARVRRRLVDVANLRAAKDLVIADTIPLFAAVSMIRDSWSMLRSCATT